MKQLTRSLAIGAAVATFGLVGPSAQAQRLSGEQLIRELQTGGYVLVMRQAPSEVRVGGGGGGGRGAFGGRGGGARGGAAAPGGAPRGGGAPGGGAPRGGGAPGGGFGGGAPGGGATGGGDPVPVLTVDSENMLIGVRHAIWYFKIPVVAVYTSPTRAAAQHAGEVPFAEIAEVAGLGEGSADSGWLAAKLAEAPLGKGNAIVVTHAPNIERDLRLANVAEGETLVVRPGDEPTIVGRLGLRDWSVLAIELEP